MFRRGGENLGVELLLCSTLVPLTFSGNVRLPVHPYERWGYFSRLERLWRASTRHACSHVPSRVARYVGIELSCDDESIVRKKSSTGEFAQELAGWCIVPLFSISGSSGCLGRPRESPVYQADTGAWLLHFQARVRRAEFVSRR